MFIDQFNASLVNKNINFFFKKLNKSYPKLLNDSVNYFI